MPEERTKTKYILILNFNITPSQKIESVFMCRNWSVESTVGGGRIPPALLLLFPPKFLSFSSFPKAFAGSVRPSSPAGEVKKGICYISRQPVELVG